MIYYWWWEQWDFVILFLFLVTLKPSKDITFFHVSVGPKNKLHCRIGEQEVYGVVFQISHSMFLPCFLPHIGEIGESWVYDITIRVSPEFIDKTQCFLWMLEWRLTRLNFVLSAWWEAHQADVTYHLSSAFNGHMETAVTGVYTQELKRLQHQIQ